MTQKVRMVQQLKLRGKRALCTQKPLEPKFMPIMRAYQKPGYPTFVDFSKLNDDWALYIHQRPLVALARQGGMSPAEIYVNIHRRPIGDIHRAGHETIFDTLMLVGKGAL
jgi:hypothetical protein